MIDIPIFLKLRTKFLIVAKAKLGPRHLTARERRKFAELRPHMMLHKSMLNLLTSRLRLMTRVVPCQLTEPRVTSVAYDVKKLSDFEACF